MKTQPFTSFLVRGLALAGGLLLFARTPLAAQELSMLGGLASSAGFDRSTYTYELDYRQDLYRYLAASFSYINEGHFDSHHRDGTAWEAWGNLPLFNERVAISIGAGVYYYYDTQPDGAGGSLDVHGTAPIFSLAATGYFSNRWFYRALVNRINPSHDIKTQEIAFGVGYWLGQERRPQGATPGANPEADDYVTPPEVTLFGGKSIVNTLFSQNDWAGAGEYRQGLMPHVDWTLTGIYEGDPKIVRRSGVATEIWPVNTFFERKLAVGFGVGPYFFIDHKHPVGVLPHSPAALAPLVSLAISRDFDDNWFARATFNRVTSNYNRDADILLLGLGYRFASR